MQQQAIIQAAAQQSIGAATGTQKLKVKEPDLYSGARDAVIVAQWQHLVYTYVQLQDIPAGQHVLLASGHSFEGTSSQLVASA